MAAPQPPREDWRTQTRSRAPATVGMASQGAMNPPSPYQPPNAGQHRPRYTGTPPNDQISSYLRPETAQLMSVRDTSVWGGPVPQMPYPGAYPHGTPFGVPATTHSFFTTNAGDYVGGYRADACRPRDTYSPPYTLGTSLTYSSQESINTYSPGGSPGPRRPRGSPPGIPYPAIGNQPPLGGNTWPTTGGDPVGDVITVPDPLEPIINLNTNQLPVGVSMVDRKSVV
jgi:hypothetical protein